MEFRDSAINQANQYLEEEYLVWLERELTVEPANSTGGFAESNGAATGANYTLRFEGEFYQIERQLIAAGLRKANARVEKRLDGLIAVRFQERYLTVRLFALARGSPGQAASADQAWQCLEQELRFEGRASDCAKA